MNINKVVKLLSTKDIFGFKPFKTLTYWSKNINIFITIDELHDFLHFFGYDYDEKKYNKKINVSKKGKFGTVALFVLLCLFVLNTAIIFPFLEQIAIIIIIFYFYVAFEYLYNLIYKSG